LKSETENFIDQKKKSKIGKFFRKSPILTQRNKGLNLLENYLEQEYFVDETKSELYQVKVSETMA